MTQQQIPAEAVEAAARVFHHDWDSHTQEPWRSLGLQRIRAALEAAAPYMHCGREGKVTIENRCLSCEGLLSWDGDTKHWWVHSDNMSDECPGDNTATIVVPDRLY